MVTCINDALFPNVGFATVRVLQRLGVEVVSPAAQTCCGQPWINTGYLRAAEPVVRNFVSAFEGFDYVVVPSGSCTGSIRHQHQMIVSRDGDAALLEASAEIAGRTYELSEFLVDVLGVTDVGATFHHSVAYHPTCHSLRMLGVADRPSTLLRQVRGLELLELPDADSCCGFGGTFAMKNPEVSVAIGRDKVRCAEATGAEFLIASDSSCLTHIGGLASRQGSGLRLAHLAQVLASEEAS